MVVRQKWQLGVWGPKKDEAAVMKCKGRGDA
jgi:hypothetical protein